MRTQARVNSKEVAEENSKAGAGKVKVYGFGRVKVTMTVPSAGKDYTFGSRKVGISYVFRDCVCSGDSMAEVKGCFSSLT